jgi:hypothetical protein
MRRREFLGSAPVFILGAAQGTAPRGPDLPEQLSAEEVEIVNKSVMAKDVENFFGKGFS